MAGHVVTLRRGGGGSRISVPSRKFDEEVLRIWRGRRPHPVRAASPGGPPGRHLPRTAGAGDGPLPAHPDPRRATRGAAEGPLRREVAIDTAECGGEGEELKEAGGRRPPPPSKPHPSPGLTPSCGGSHSPGEALRFATGCCAREGAVRPVGLRPGAPARTGWG